MTIEENVKNIVRNKFNVDVVGSKTHFVDDLGADSLDIMEFVMDIEDAFDISIPENDIREGMFKTVGQLISYIREKIEPQTTKKASVKN
jgi:acyl carrier protein